MRGFGGITDSVDMSLSKLQEMMKAGEAWHAAAQGVTKSWNDLETMTNFPSFVAISIVSTLVTILAL